MCTWKQWVSHCACTLFSELFSNSLRMKAWMKQGVQHSNDDQKKCSFAAHLNRIRNLHRQCWRRTKKTVPEKLFNKMLGDPRSYFDRKLLVVCLLKMPDTSWPNEMVNTVTFSLHCCIETIFPWNWQHLSWRKLMAICIYVKSLADSIITVLQYKDSKYS